MKKHELIKYLKNSFKEYYFLPTKNWPLDEFNYRAIQRYAANDILHFVSNSVENDPVSLLYNYIYRMHVIEHEITGDDEHCIELHNICKICIEVAEDIITDFMFPTE